MSDHHDDNWFVHKTADGKPQEAHGEINAQLILGFLAVVIISVVIVFITIGGFFFQTVNTLRGEAEAGSRVSDQSNVAAAAWAAEKTSSGWVDEANNIARIPVDLAAAEIIRRYESGAPLADYPPEVVQPAAAEE